MPIASSCSELDITFSSEKYDITADIIACKKRLLPPKISDLYWLPIDSVRVLTNEDDVHKVLEISLYNWPSFDFKAGDTIGILPENDIAEVEFLLQSINATSFSDCKFTLIYNDDDKNRMPSHLPTTGSLKYVFQHFVDIRRVLNKRVVSALCAYTYDPIEKSELENICKGKGLYSKQILNKNVNILDFLKLYPSCRPPVTILLQQLPQLMPRPYTICNYPKLSSDVIKICFSVVRHDNGRSGLATGMLEKLSNQLDYTNINNLSKNLSSLQFNNTKSLSPIKNIEIPAFFKPSIFHPPIDQSIPLIMICNGTGIAPFIGFLEERQFFNKKNPVSNCGLSRLYYGCRYSNRDFLYKDKLAEFLNDGTLNQLITAHSRQDGDCKYVQDKLSSDTETILNLIDESAVIYVCGSNNMAKQVDLYFIDILKKANAVSEIDAKTIFKNMKLNGKYIQDIWL